MPNKYLSRLHIERGISMDTLESKWKEAKKKAIEQGEDGNYAYVTSIFKHLLGESNLPKISFEEFVSLSE